MTKNQISLLEVREKERANRAQEDLTRRGQNIQGIGTTLRGAGSFISSLHPAGRLLSHIVGGGR